MRKVFQILFLLLFLVMTYFLGSAQEKDARDYTAHLIGHAHIDLSWLWRWEETVHDIAFETFQGVLAQMEKMPGLTFAQSQAAIYEAIEKNYPELFKAIKARIKEGTWIPVGGMWVEPDLNMPDGESLVRQLLYGKKYFLEKFGADVKVGWNPDSFGHNFQLPQILSKSGIKYYIFGRCAPEKTVAFWWEGADGSRVLSYVPPGWYNVSLRHGTKDIIFEAAKIAPLKDYMLLYGEGDHGGGPRSSDLEAIEKYKKDKNQPKIKFVRPQDYFQLIEEQKFEIPGFKNELNFTFPACYTTQAEIKKNNRLAESLLLSAEKFSSLAFAAGYRDYYPERDLDEAWKIVLRNQFHDILDGSSIGPVYDEARRFFREVFERGRRSLDFSLEAITNHIDTRGEGIPLVIFNQLFWERTEPVTGEVTLQKDSGSIKIQDNQGAEIPFQIIERREIDDQILYRFLFIAEKIPSFGYKVFRVVNSDRASEFKTSLSVRENEMENEFFKIKINPRTGWLESVYDKLKAREALQGNANVLQAVVDEPESMSAWELGLKDQFWNIGEEGARIKPVEPGPMRGVVRVKNIFRNSSFVQDIILYDRIPRIDFRLNLDWQERNLMIKASFPLNLKNKTADFEIPFGYVTRKTDGTEVPAIRWVDFTDESGDYGLSLLNDCKYGFDIKENNLRLSVIHGATSPDPEADRGVHELMYSLYPHRGTWKESNSARRGYEFNNPLLLKKAMVHPGKLPSSSSFLKIEPENVIISALKKEAGYYNSGIILRLYEAFGQKAEVKIDFPWPVDVYEIDLMERPVKEIEASEESIAFTLSPFEIKTLKLIKK